MRQLLIALIIIVLGYKAIQEWRQSKGPGPLLDTPYVIVYGRESCGYTQAMREQLAQARVPFKFQSVDDAAVADVLHARMQASGMDISYYNLPVVDVSGRLSIRPDSVQVVQDYSAPPG